MVEYAFRTKNMAAWKRVGVLKDGFANRACELLLEPSESIKLRWCEVESLHVTLQNSALRALSPSAADALAPEASHFGVGCDFNGFSPISSVASPPVGHWRALLYRFYSFPAFLGKKPNSQFQI